MSPIKIPTKEQVPPESRKYFDYFIANLGMMPNLYAVLAYSEAGISTYMQLQKRKRILNLRESEIVGLVVSAMHESNYCLETHAMIAKLNGFSDAQIREVKQGKAGFDHKLDVLAHLVHSTLLNKTRVDQATLDAFFEAGYGLPHLLDVAMTIADNVISNIVSNTLHLPADQPTEW
ncbi:MAG TPA: carboxymuconolactone decarboxylase family protein [Puia sp.]|nr:carboxymuconolactone decarboxylase family protein [Puia sp.]